MYACTFEGPYVDTVTMHGSDTVNVAGFRSPDPKVEPEHFFSNLALMVPFGAWTTD